MTEAAGEMKGGMIALPLSREEAAEMLEKSGADLVIANDNGPKQVVLSGAAGEVEKALNWFAGEGVNAVRLPVANAFHSGIVADAVAPFRSVLDDLDLAEARIPVIAGTTGATYGEGADDIRAVLGGQIAAPISFRKQVETLYASGVRRFVEVGPASVLTGLVRQCLDGREHLAVSLDRKGENGVTAFLEGIAALAVSGVDMDYAWLWQEAAPDPEPVAAPKHAVDIRGSNYGKPYPPENGAAGRHAPNPEKPVEPVAQTAPAPAAAPQAPSPQPLTPGASADFQRQLAETHLAFQQSMADSHRAFLETMERLAWGQPSAMPATASVPAAMPAPAAAVAQTMAPPQSMAPPQPAQSVSAPSPVQPAPTVPAAQKPAPSKSGSADPAAVVIGLVAEKTGYPADMLSLDMDLEADLGIDSIKQVEILSSLRDALPGLAEPDPGMLSEMATLRKIVEFVGEAASGSEASGTPEAESSAGPDSSLLIAVVAEKTGYPADMLSLDMELEGDLGIDSIKQVEILSSIREQFPDMPEIDPGQLSELKTLGAIVDFLGVQEAPVAVATSPAASVAASPVSSTGPDSAALLAVVAAKTGYPADMLSLDMELEGDLGIDSIKQVEILSSVREQFPDMPEIDPGQLSELRTIGAILAQLGGAVVAPVAEAATVASSEIGFDSAVLLEVVADKTGYPADMLSLEMELEGDLGIDSIKQVEILSSLRDRYPSMPEADPSLLSELRTLGAILDWLDGDAAEEPVATTDEPVRPAREVARWVVRPTPAPVPAGSGVSLPANAKLVIMPSRAPIASALAEAFSRHGVEAVLSDEADADAFGLVLIAGDEGDAADHVISSVMAASAMAPRLKQSGGLFVTVEDLGGDFGLGGCVSDRAWRSGLAGLAGTARQEWPHASVKAIDIDLSRRDEADAAEALVQEILRGGPEGEVALSVSEGRRVPVSTAAPLIPLTGRSGLRGGMVIVASAGARGITAASLIEFARHHKLKLALLGRTAYQPESDDSLRDAKDEPALIKALAGRGGRSGDPSMLRARARAILQSREITETIDRLTELGSEVKYLTADIRDAGQVTECVARVRADWGPVTGIVHGAGVLADRRLEDKTAEQVRAVAVTKLDGLANMLAAVADDPLEMICLFSSAAGVAGNVGQSDYAMVNRVMDNVASSLQAERPDCVVKSVAWGPWEGGMVDAGLAALFKARGIDLIPLDAGTAFLRHELEAGGSDCRVIAGSADLGGATGKPAGSGGEGEAQAAAGD
jgi:malonyl CoA-acyl carrier protein transacylase/NADP-dependent 3-hydroxy acid dehydrogenase YdfG